MVPSLESSAFRSEHPTPLRWYLHAALLLAMGFAFAAVAAPLPEPIPSNHLHNLFRVADRIYSGSSPDHDADFAELKRLGVTTIVSVDGARPNLQAAREHGLRYVHLPIGYDGISEERKAQLVKAASSLSGTLYVHCHHGKHRGPAAAALICLATERWSPEQAVGWLRKAGTSSDYPGLYRTVEQFESPPAPALDAVASLPEVTPPSSVVESMVALDLHAEHLAAARKAGWTNIPGHSDLDPRHEATLLWELLRELGRAPSPAPLEADYRKRHTESEHAAETLRSALTPVPPDPAKADAAMKSLMDTCAACHRAHRNARK